MAEAATDEEDLYFEATLLLPAKEALVEGVICFGCPTLVALETFSDLVVVEEDLDSFAGFVSSDVIDWRLTNVLG